MGKDGPLLKRITLITSGKPGLIGINALLGYPLSNGLNQAEEEHAMTATKKAHRSHEKSATAGEIRAIVGPLDDDIVVAILETGATRVDVIQAFDWLEESYYTMSTFMRPMNERVRRVYEILDYASNGFGQENSWWGGT